MSPRVPAVDPASLHVCDLSAGWAPLCEFLGCAIPEAPFPHVNTRAAFIASQAATAHMGENGRIISIGSNLAERVPGPGLSLYSLSKAALVGLTKGMARDLGPRGITVNIVHPGSTDTDMNPANGEHADGQRHLMAIPRFGEPRDIASLVAWLASDESRFVTGSAFTIDGGANA